MHELGLTVAKAMVGPAIRTMRSEQSDMLLLTSVTYLVNRAAKFSETFKPLPEDLALSLAIDLLEVMEFDTIDDIILMFKMARQGKLNISALKKKKSFYEAVLQDYVPAYLEEKAKERERQYYAQRMKETKEAEPTTEEAIANRKKFTENIKALRLSIESESKAKKKAKDDVLNNYAKTTPEGNQDVLKKQITTFAAKLDKKQLKEQIEDWKKYNDKRPYVYIFEAALKNYKS